MPPIRPAAAAAPPGRREQRKHVTRRELIAAGRRLFGEQGLYESRIEDLARRAGIAKGTLYGYFESKEALVLAVVTEGFAELLGRVRTSVAGARTARERVRAVAAAHLEFFAAQPDLMRILHQVRGLLKFERPEWGPLRDALGHHVAATALLLAGSLDGRRRPTRAELERAELLFGAVSGVTSVRAALGGVYGRAARAAATVDALERMLGPAPPDRPRRRMLRGPPGRV